MEPPGKRERSRSAEEEPNVAQLADGRVILTSRNTNERNRRLASYSDDGATNWSEPQLVEHLLEPGCMAGIVAYPGGDGVLGSVLLFSNPHTTKRKHSHDTTLPSSSVMMVALTWPVQKLLEDGPSIQRPGSPAGRIYSMLL